MEIIAASIVPRPPVVSGGYRSDYIALLIRLAPDEKPRRAILLERGPHWDLVTERFARGMLREAFEQHPLTE